MHFHSRVHSIVRGSPLAVALAVVAACSSSSSGGGSTSLSSVEGILEPNAGSCSSPGGPVVGPDDNHCVNPDGTPILQTITPAACTDGDAGAPSGSSSGGGDDGGGGTSDGGGDGGGMTADAGGDAGMPDIGNCGQSAYGATNDNDHAGDDDCKYNVEWSSTPICLNQPVYFTVVVTHRVDGTPVTGATPVPDVVLNCNHPIPNGPNGQPTARKPSPEITPGVYVVGPITFDRSGKWVFRFHFFEDCLDLPWSPHGHAAFYVNVP